MGEETNGNAGIRNYVESVNAGIRNYVGKQGMRKRRRGGREGQRAEGMYSRMNGGG